MISNPPGRLAGDLLAGFCPLPFPSVGDRWFRAYCQLIT